jgi:hypothetical protein
MEIGTLYGEQLKAGRVPIRKVIPPGPQGVASFIWHPRQIGETAMAAREEF